MTIRSAIYTRLSGFSGLTSLVSTRIYRKDVPQNPTYPLVFFELTDRSRVSAMNGDSGTVDTYVRVISMGQTSASAELVAEQVRAALQRYSGTSESVIITDVFIDGEADYYDDELDIAHIEQNYLIYHKE